VVIADDHPLFLGALEGALEDAGVQVGASTTRGRDVVDLVDKFNPDVVLLDLEMPDLDGLTCLSALKERWPSLKVVIVSGSDDRAKVDEALRLGAVCFIGKTVEPTDLAHAVRMIAGDQPFHYAAPHPTTANHQTEGPATDLTRRELEILQMVSHGHSNSQLARILWVTEQTIKFHLSNVYRKLDVQNRTEAGAKARELGISDNGTCACFEKDLRLAQSK